MMKSEALLLPALLCSLAGAASAQAPTFTLLPGSSAAWDASVSCGTVVAGTTGAGAFRYTATDGVVNIGGDPSNGSGEVRISRSGTTIAGDTVGSDGRYRASIWNGGTSWTQLPGLGGSSGTSETGTYGVSGDGSVVVGLGWINAGTAHAFRWTQATGNVDLGSTVPGRSTRANDISDDGNVVIGWQDSSTGLRQGARWIGGVQSLFTYTDPSSNVFSCGEALGTNIDGSIVVGYNVFGGPNSGWRWDSATGVTTLLPNLAGQAAGNHALANGVSDNGTRIVGSNGGSPFTRKAILWNNNVPVDLLPYLISLGTTGLSGYTSLGTGLNISADGRVIVGFGISPAFGMPAGGWMVTFPEPIASTVGTAYCFGDGSGAACPCGNAGAVGHGCANSVNTAGGVLGSVGVASVSADTLILISEDQPHSNCLFFQGTGTSSLPLFDGIRCVGGAVIRLGIETSDVAGSACYPRPGSSDLPVSVRGAIPALGGSYNYQVWYRDPAAFCTPDTSNFSSGYSLVWIP